VLLGGTPYSRPFAKLGQLRSAGITDLRYGHVLDADWQGHDRFRRTPDRRIPLPLPSALGQHDDPQRSLTFTPAHQYIACRTSHLALLSSPAVAQQIITWLKP
jgi:hypothetical protein